MACPFNYLHRVKPEDREDHVMLCEDRAILKYTQRESPSYGNTLKQFYKVKKTIVKPPPTDTDWNEESTS